MPNFTQWLMGIISAVLVGIGIALCFAFTGGMGLIVGSALLAGGASGFMATYHELSWGDFWKSVISGVIVGAISGLASPLIANVASTFASMMGHQLSNYLIHMAVSVVGHMAISFVTNGIQNLFRGQSFTQNWKQALISGAVIGAVSSAVYIIQDYGVDKIIQKTETFMKEYGTNPLVKQFIDPIKDYIPNYISRMNDGFLKNAAQFAWDKFQTMTSPQIATFINNNIHYIAEFVVGAATEYVMHGRVNLLLAAGQAIAYGCANWSLASRNLPRQYMRQVPPPGLVYSTNSITDTIRGNLRTGNDEGEQHARPASTPEAQIPATREPLPADATRTVEPPTYEEATRDDVTLLPTVEPSLPNEIPSVSSSAISVDKLSTSTATTAQPFHQINDSVPVVTTTPYETEAIMTAIVDIVAPQQNVFDIPDTNQLNLVQDTNVSSTATTSLMNKNTNTAKALSLNEFRLQHPASTSTPAKATPVTEKANNIISHVNEPSPTLLNSVTKQSDIETNLSTKVEEPGAVIVTDYKSEKKGGDNAKIAIEYLTFNHGLSDDDDEEEVHVHQANVHQQEQKFEILTKNSNELSSDEEFEIITDYESYAVDMTDGNEIINIETELFKVDKILQEQEQNQIKESCRNSRVEVWQYNTEDYAQKVGVHIQSSNNRDNNAAKPKKSILEALKLTKNNIVPNIPDFCKPSTWTTARQQKKYVFICPFVIFNEDEAKYQLLDPQEWPVFPENGVRVVTVSGAHSSGRTTFIHSLAYTLGYSLNEEQAITSRFPTGVFMYLFHEDNLLILDCTDSFTRIDDNLAPSALTLELFCYLISDHRIHHFAMGDNPQRYIQHCENTMKMLFKSGAFVELQGGRMATLLLRYSDRMSKKELKTFNEMRSDYQKLTEEKVETYRNLIDALNDPTKFADPEGNEMTGLKVAKKDELGELYEDRSYDLKIEKLLILPKLYSPMEQQLYHSEIKRIADMIIKTTPIHHTFEKFGEEVSSEIKDQKPSFAELVSEVWYRVADNKELFESTTNAMNRHTVTQSGDKFNVEKYFNDIRNYFGNVEGVMDVFEWIKKAAEENAKNSEKDAMFVFRGIARVAEAVLKERKKGNCKYFESCVQHCFTGLLLFFGQHEKNFELLSVKAVIEDTKILEELIDDAIIQNFATVWAYFYHLAYYLFRLELINVGIVEKAIKVLKRKGNGTEDQQIKANIYAALSMLIYADVNCILGQKAPPTENKKVLDEEDFIDVHYRFEKEAEIFLNRFKEGREYKTREEFHTAYGEMMEFPKTYFDGTENSVFARNRNLSYEELDPPVKYRFECTMLKHFYNAIGYYVSKKIIENSEHFMPRISEEIVLLPQYTVNMQKQGLNLWACIGNLSVAFENLLPKILLKSNFKQWLLTYRKSLQELNLVPVLHLCNVIAYSESIYDYIPHPEFQHITDKNQDFHDLQLLNQQKRLAEHYRHIVYDILENTKISKAVKAFCEKSFDSSMIEEAETWIIHLEKLLKQGLEKDDKGKCLFAFLDRRFEIIKKLGNVAVLAELTLSNDDNLSSSDTVTKALKLVFAIPQFLNKLLVLHKAEENDNFFNPGQKDNMHSNVLPANSEIWGELTKIFGILANKIIKNGRYYLSKSEMDSNVYEHGLLYVLWFIYNLSSISKITFSSFINLLPNNISFDYLKAQSEEKLIHKIEDYCSLEVRNYEKKDVQIIQTAAYIWAKYSTITIESLRDTFHEECSILISAFDESIKLWRCTEIRNKKIEDFKKRLTASAENSEIINRFAEQLSTQPVQSYRIDDTMRFMEMAKGQKAIDDLIFSAHGHSFFEGWQVTAPNPEQKLLNALIANRGKIKALAVMFMLGNDEIEKIHFILRHFQRLLDKPPTNDKPAGLTLKTKADDGKPNLKVQELFKLNFILDVFIELGYKKSESEEDGIKLKATISSIQATTNKIKEFLDFIPALNDKIGNLIFKSVFVEAKNLTTNKGDEIGVFEYLELPSIFVKNTNNAIPTLTVKYLRENRVNNNIQLQYALIRIQMENGKTIQAGFLAVAFLESVINSLAHYLDVEKQRIQLFDMQNKQLFSRQNLESLGLVPGGYLKAVIL